VSGRGAARRISAAMGSGSPSRTSVRQLSGNHDGNIERALALVDAAAEAPADADAMKLQTYKA